MKILCDKENIPCILVVGNINLETNFAHMWNYVQMEDGQWYAVDCTWDDLDDETNPVTSLKGLKVLTVIILRIIRI